MATRNWITPAVPSNTVAPVISPGSGTASSTTFTVTNGTWSGSPSGYSYQWKLDGSNVGNNASSYGPVASGTLTCVVTAVNAFGSNTGTATGVTVSSGSFTPEVSYDFEAGSGTGTWFDTYNTASTSTDQAYAGTKSLKCTVTSAQTDLGFLAGRPTTRLVQGDELWVRFRTFFPTGYNFSAGPHLKFFRIDQGTSASGGHGAHIDWYIRPGGVGAGSTAVGVFDFIQENVQSWLYDDDTLPTGIVRNTWQTWNLYYKLHSVAASGRIRLWRDTTLLVDSTARACLGGSGYVVGAKSDGSAQGIMLMTYWNGGAPATQSFYVDDWQVATSASPPTATDSGGRIWIGT